MPPNPSIIIVGAGIAGLTFAIMLERAGMGRYIILERHPSPRPLGSALCVSAMVLRVYEQLGLLEEVIAVCKPSVGHTFLDSELNFVSNMDALFVAKRYGYFNSILTRPDLHQILLNHVPAHKILYSKKVLGFNQTSECATIRTSDNSYYRADIVIGADGAYSGTRQNIYRAIQYENGTQGAHPLDKGTQGMAFGGGKVMVSMEEAVTKVVNARSVDGRKGSVGSSLASTTLASTSGTSLSGSPLYPQPSSGSNGLFSKAPWASCEGGKLPLSDVAPLRFDQNAVTGVTRALDPEKYPLVRVSYCQVVTVLTNTGLSFWLFTVPGNRVAWCVGGRKLTPEDTQPKGKSNLEPNFRLSEWGPESVQEILRDGRIRHQKCPFGGTFGDLMDQTDPDTVVKFMNEDKSFKTWYYRRTALIGDACHKTIPFGGVGVVHAVLDGVTLMNALYDMPDDNKFTQDDITKAFRAYYTHRWASADAAVQGNRQLSEFISGTGSMNDWFRKGALSILPKFLLELSADKIFADRPLLTFLPFVPDFGTKMSKPQRLGRRDREELERLMELEKKIEGEKVDAVEEEVGEKGFKLMGLPKMIKGRRGQGTGSSVIHHNGSSRILAQGGMHDSVPTSAWKSLSSPVLASSPLPYSLSRSKVALEHPVRSNAMPTLPYAHHQQDYQHQSSFTSEKSRPRGIHPPSNEVGSKTYTFKDIPFTALSIAIEYERTRETLYPYVKIRPGSSIRSATSAKARSASYSGLSSSTASMKVLYTSEDAPPVPNCSQETSPALRSRFQRRPSIAPTVDSMYYGHVHRRRGSIAPSLAPSEASSRGSIASTLYRRFGSSASSFDLSRSSFMTSAAASSYSPPCIDTVTLGCYDSYTSFLTALAKASSGATSFADEMSMPLSPMSLASSSSSLVEVHAWERDSTAFGLGPVMVPGVYHHASQVDTDRQQYAPVQSRPESSVLPLWDQAPETFLSGAVILPPPMAYPTGSLSPLSSPSHSRPGFIKSVSAPILLMNRGGDEKARNQRHGKERLGAMATMDTYDYHYYNSPKAYQDAVAHQDASEAKAVAEAYYSSMTSKATVPGRQEEESLLVKDQERRERIQDDTQQPSSYSLGPRMDGCQEEIGSGDDAVYGEDDDNEDDNDRASIASSAISITASEKYRQKAKQWARLEKLRVRWNTYASYSSASSSFFSGTLVSPRVAAVAAADAGSVSYKEQRKDEAEVEKEYGEDKVSRVLGRSDSNGKVESTTRAVRVRAKEMRILPGASVV